MVGQNIPAKAKNYINNATFTADIFCLISQSNKNISAKAKNYINNATDIYILIYTDLYIVLLHKVNTCQGQDPGVATYPPTIPLLRAKFGKDEKWVFIFTCHVFLSISRYLVSLELCLVPSTLDGSM